MLTDQLKRWVYIDNEKINANSIVPISIAIFLLIQGNTLKAQFVKSEFRTVRENNFPLHYLKFLPNGAAQIRFPVTNHGQAMIGMRESTYDLKYTVKGDTLRFTPTGRPDTVNLIVKMILSGKFLIKSSHFILDIQSGYPFVSKKMAPENEVLFVLDKKRFKQKIPKVDCYGLVEKEYRQNRKLKKELKNIDLDSYNGQVIRGLVAFRKYGVDGMNIVYEYERKK